jgi:hypothetical protein
MEGKEGATRADLSILIRRLKLVFRNPQKRDEGWRDGGMGGEPLECASSVSMGI